MSTPTFPPCLPPLFGFVLHPRNVYICVKERDDIGSIGREAVDRETAHIRCFRIRSRLWFFEFFQTCGVKSPKLVPPTSILLLLLFLHLSLPRFLFEWPLPPSRELQPSSASPHSSFPVVKRKVPQKYSIFLPLLFFVIQAIQLLHPKNIYWICHDCDLL